MGIYIFTEEKIVKRGIGNFLWNCIEEKKIKKKELCKGLCSQSELSKILVESKILSYFVMQRLLERMGISTESFEYIVPEKDYELCDLRYEIEHNLQEKQFENIKDLLEQYDSKIYNNTVHKQYIYYIKALVEIQIGDMEQALGFLEKSIAYTMPNGVYHDVILGLEEIKLLLFYQKLKYEYKTKTKRGQKKYYHFLEIMKKYVDDTIEDEEVKASIYPRITNDMIEICMENRHYKKAEELCKKTITLLRENFMLDGLLEHMKLLRIIYQNRKVDEKETYQIERMYQALCLFYKEAGDYKEEYLIGKSMKQISLGADVIKQIRNTYQLSQQKLANDIYTRESISRIENRKKNISYKKLREIIQTFGIDMDIYNTVLKTINFRTLQLEKEMTLHFKRREWKSARELLEKIKKELLEDSIVNEQFFQYNTAILQYEMKEINTNEYKERLEQALYLTKPKQFDIVNGYLTRQEVYIMNCISISIYEMGNKEKALQLWSQLLEHYDTSVGYDLFNYHNIILILSNLVKIMEESGKIEEAELIYERAIKLSKKARRADRIGRFLYMKGWILEHYKNQKEKAYPYYEQAFWIFILFKQYRYSETVRKYYKDITGSGLFLERIQDYQEE